jgi:cytoskeletal protein CcmA (bactofilin family)
VGFGWLVRNQPGNASVSVLALSVAGVLLTAAPGSHAFEMRRDEQRVVVGPDEVIDDTLIITSEDVLIEGTVTGDLIAISESLRIRGRVDGLVIAIGESVQLEGTFGQSVLGLGEKVEVRGATLGANFYGAGERVLIQKDVVINGNLAAAGEEAEMHGSVAGDLISAGERVTLFGSVDGDMRGYGATVELTDSARVNGDLTLMTDGAETALVAPGAVVSGATNTNSWPEEPSRYTNPEFYLGELLQIFAAFVTGLVLFRFLPALANVELQGGTEVLVTAGLGAAVLVGTPVLAVAAMITLIGAPLGLMLFVAWLVTLYAAGIVIANCIGRLILPGRSPNRALPLLLGLALLVVLSEVPILGGPVRLVAGILGLGLIAEWLRSLWLARGA